MYPDRGCHILLWGISSEEFLARQYASTKKISLYLAKAIISRAGHQGTISQHSSDNNINAISTTPFEPISIPPKDKFRKCTELSSIPQSKEATRKATRNATNDEYASSNEPVSADDVTDRSPASTRVTTNEGSADGSASTIKPIASSDANESNEMVKVMEKKKGWYGGVGDIVRKFLP